MGYGLALYPTALTAELSQEEFQDNIRLIYGLMPQDISATCDGCGKRFLI